MSPVWLVAYDFSPHADVILEKAAEELNVHRGVLCLVHVSPTPVALTSFEVQRGGSAVNRNVEDHLDDVAKDIAKRFSEMTVRHIVREGDAAEEIMGAAKDLQVDRIVVGTHGRTGVGRVLMGSVAERIVRLSPVSVLVIKS